MGSILSRNEPSDEPGTIQVRWERAFLLLYACLPPERKQEVDDQMAGDNELQWFAAGWTIFAHICGLTFALGIGWCIHAFLL